MAALWGFLGHWHFECSKAQQSYMSTKCLAILVAVRLRRGSRNLVKYRAASVPFLKCLVFERQAGAQAEPKGHTKNFCFADFFSPFQS